MVFQKVKKLFLFTLLSVSAVYAGELPDKQLTPGNMRNVTVRELCTTSTSLVRNVPESEKKAVYSLYGLDGNKKDLCGEGYEIDHLVSLELGGDNTVVIYGLKVIVVRIMLMIKIN